MLELFNKTTFACSKIITQNYSTSFTMGIKTLHKKFHAPIYGIYGFVRFADEIVDTFHDFDKKTLLQRFKEDTYRAIDEKISLNPVLHSFQMVVHQYKIEHDLIDAFLKSMEMDLYLSDYEQTGYETYIYGSAEVVGLMCLRVFCEGNLALFDDLKSGAKSLGSAFQKVNFLRDIKDDFEDKGRTYFPNIDFTNFSLADKQLIEADIQQDFDAAYQGIMGLPREARMGVHLAYTYYLQLLTKIKNTPPSKIMTERIRVPNARKFALLAKTYLKFQMNV
jgi:phytoene/squalene synthetase